MGHVGKYIGSHISGLDSIVDRVGKSFLLKDSNTVHSKMGFLSTAAQSISGHTRAVQFDVGGVLLEYNR